MANPAAPFPRTVLVAGASGYLGSHLVRHLRHRGVTVRRLVRRPARGPEEFSWDPAAGRFPQDALTGVDAVVNLGGANLGRRWTRSYKETILRSRTEGTGLIAEGLAQHAADLPADAPRPRLLQASAVGYYGDRGEEQLTEAAPPGQGFLAEVVQAWEGATVPASAAGVPVALLRTGIVLAPTGGAMGRMMLLLRTGLAGPLGTGRHWWPWITLADHVRAQLHLLTSELTGPVNLSAPQPARNAEVIREVAHAMHRPAVLRVPRW
ncbi:TIGR01777 family oxidoreductase, partial [Georgenia sp. 10Sc9-8]|nr:TIGR01777 family oxidoreductase [Georgenia halotolerans]